MKRQWYDHNFDKDALMTKEVIYKTKKRQEAIESLTDRKSKFMMNLVEFCVGAGLLIFCFSYLQSHPAEKSSLFSGSEAIYEKIKTTVYKWTGGKSEELIAKYKVEKQYQEIIDIAILWNCLEDVKIRQLEEVLATIEALSVEEFMAKKRWYEKVYELYFDDVEESCNLRNR